ncbi:MAG: hypothetical protein HY902_11295 [Deltaproteobacteria bacterium]|nr:hypothetical protein [Deltaproteobacteria bacterium]
MIAPLARPTARALVWLIGWLVLIPAGCVVNPVPTPGSGGTTVLAGDTGGGIGKTNDAAADLGGTADDATAAPNSDALDSFVPATDTQTGVSGEFGDHLAIFDPAVPSSGDLVVLLPGSNMQPKDYSKILWVAAQRGHRVLGLAYPANPSAASLCGENSTCYEYVRHEVLDGQDRSDKIKVGFNNCIEQRLALALQWLVKHRPGQGWGNYVAGSTPLWQNIVVVGHGEGAGHAGFIGKVRKVARVVLLQGPLDSTAQGPAAWIASAAQTPASAWFGLADKTAGDFNKISANWIALGLGTSWSPVTGLGAFGSAHGVVSESPVAADAELQAGSDGDPAPMPAWWYLFTP